MRQDNVVQRFPYADSKLPSIAVHSDLSDGGSTHVSVQLPSLVRSS